MKAASENVRGVLISTNDCERGHSCGHGCPGTNLLLQPGTLALLRLLDQHNIATGILSPDTADPAALSDVTPRVQPPRVVRYKAARTRDSRTTGRLIAAQAQQAGFRVRSSAVMTTRPEIVEAARAAGFGTVILIKADAPASTPQSAQRADAGAMLTARDAAELTWSTTLGLHIKTLDSLPDIAGMPDPLPFGTAISRPLLFLDYDGTLTPIIDDPARALLPEPVRNTLAELGRLTTVTIVSGRDLTLLRNLVGIRHLWYAGSHGFEIIGPEGSGIAHTSGAAFAADLDAAEQALNRLLGDFPGHLIERKRMTIAVHYRNMAGSMAQQLQHQVEGLIADHPMLHIGHGKMVMEVRPAIRWDKGEAVTWILSQLPASGRGALPVYIGDDLTDEDAFRKLAGRGLGIAVRHDESRPTAADYAVDDTDAVNELLTRLLAEFRACER